MFKDKNFTIPEKKELIKSAVVNGGVMLLAALVLFLVDTLTAFLFLR